MRLTGAICAVLTAFVPIVAVAEVDLSGNVELEMRLYPASPKFPSQNDSFIGPSVALQPEVRWDFSAKQRVTLIPFARLDAIDAQRTHFDVRELNWLYNSGDWDLRVGVGKVFWGVVESRHLVDIINQTDLVEDINEDEKLGQPMINANVITGVGTFSGFLLPYFRERTFPGPEGRPSFSVPIDTTHPVYESSEKERHIDFALRWQERFSAFDVGLAYFHGTGREPRLVPAFTTSGPVLVPHYDLIDQASIDAQATIGAWLLKLEAIGRSGQGHTFFASVAGFEYTLSQVFERDADLGLFAEYNFDGRHVAAPPTIFNNDVMVGLRFSFNDAADSSILAGAIVDLDKQSTALKIESGTRLSDGLRLSVDAWIFPYVASGDLLKSFDHDHMIRVRLQKFF